MSIFYRDQVKLLAVYALVFMMRFSYSQENAWIVPQFRIWPCFHTSLTVYCSLYASTSLWFEALTGVTLKNTKFTSILEEPAIINLG